MSSHSEIIKAVIAGLALVLVWIAWFLERRAARLAAPPPVGPGSATALPAATPPTGEPSAGSSAASAPTSQRTGRNWVTIALAALALFSCLNYARYDLGRYWTRVENYDLLHYYLNSKYFPELEYDRLYAAIILADQQYKHRLKQIPNIRRLSDYRTLPKAQVLAGHPELQARFTPDRWRAFQEDVDYLVRRMNRRELDRALTDRGFHGTPTWTWLTHALTNQVPLRWMYWPAKLDLLLMGAALVLLWRTLGSQVALLVLIFCTTFFAFRWPMLGGALLRYDWLAATIAGICLLERGRYRGAGVAFTYAALIRIFPLLFAVPVGLKLIAESIHARRVTPALKGFVIASVLTAVVLLAIPTARFGTTPFHGFSSIMSLHLAPHTLSQQRMGSAVALTYEGEFIFSQQVPRNWYNDKRTAIGKLGTPAKLFGLLFLVFVWSFMRRQDATGLVAAGFLLFFIMFNASCYYYASMLILLIWHMKQVASHWHGLGLTFVWLLVAYASTIEVYHGRVRYFLTATASVLIAGYLLFVVIAWLITARASRRAAGKAAAFEPAA